MPAAFPVEACLQVACFLGFQAGVAKRREGCEGRKIELVEAGRLECRAAGDPRLPFGGKPIAVGQRAGAARTKLGVIVAPQGRLPAMSGYAALIASDEGTHSAIPDCIAGRAVHRLFDVLQHQQQVAHRKAQVVLPGQLPLRGGEQAARRRVALGLVFAHAPAQGRGPYVADPVAQVEAIDAGLVVVIGVDQYAAAVESTATAGIEQGGADFVAFSEFVYHAPRIRCVAIAVGIPVGHRALGGPEAQRICGDVEAGGRQARRGEAVGPGPLAS